MRIGLLGAGYIASWHLNALARLRGAQVTAICDLSEEKARGLAEQVGASWFPTLAELLEANVCDCVHVLLPPPAHAQCAMEVVEAGKHVFLEKPMCLSSADCKAVLDQAASRGVKVGVNHNFLCLPSVDQLIRAIRGKLLGPIVHLTADWMFPLSQYRSGPFDSWLFERPGNSFFEVAPHPLAFVAYLLDDIHEITTRADDRIELPNGRVSYRRWQLIGATNAGTGFTVRVSLADGFSKRTVEVVGLGGRAIVDFERDVFTLERSSRHDIVVEPFLSARSLSNQIRRESRRNLRTQLLSLDKLSPFGLSLTRSIDAFYSSLTGQQDARVSGLLGQKVIELAERSVNTALYAETFAPSAKRTALGPEQACTSDELPISRVNSVPLNRKAGNVLVIGGGGFIGQRLVRKLADVGYRVCVLGRRSRPELDGYLDRVEVIQGTTSKESLRSSLDSIDFVYHLAFPSEARKWDEYLRGDVEVARRIGQACSESGVRAFVYTGTIDSFYLGARRKILESTGLDPEIHRRNFYARSKAECENVLRQLQHEHGLSLVIARPGIVIGRGGNPQHPGVGLWRSPTVCSLWGSGNHPLPLVLVDDVADALVRILDAPCAIGEDYNLVGDPLLSARQYVAAYEAALKCHVTLHNQAIWRYFLWDCGKTTLKLAARRFDGRFPSYRDWRSRSQAAMFDNAKAKEHLGWTPVAERDRLIEEGIDAAVLAYFQIPVH